MSVFADKRAANAAHSSVDGGELALGRTMLAGRPSVSALLADITDCSVTHVRVSYADTVNLSPANDSVTT